MRASGGQAMSEAAVMEILDRAVNDAGFRALLQRAPDEALAGYDLTPQERERFRGSALRAEALEERVSKTDLTGLTSAKTGAPVTKPPSQLKDR